MGSDETRREFLEGYEAVMYPERRTAGGQEVVVTRADSPWLGTRCPVDQTPFKEGDRVVLCPRSEGAPLHAYHEDVDSGLTCWSDWWSDRSINRYCAFLNCNYRLPRE